MSQIKCPDAARRHVLTFLAANTSPRKSSTECNNFERFDPYEGDVTYRSDKQEMTRDSVKDHKGHEKQEDQEDEDMWLADDARLIEDEYRMEPTPPPVDMGLNTEQDEGLPQSHPVFRLRGGHEEGLKSDPFVVKFPGLAGNSQVVNEDQDEDNIAAASETHQGNALGTNPFAPFLSKLDWDMAQWAKLRGPGSTAFTELMGIEGVSRALLVEV